jgi:hypothetical protein
MLQESKYGRKGRGGVKKGQVTQTLYAHMNKRKDKRLSTNQEGKA